MQIVIPMSGFGERFRRAGYDIPKPLIEVQDKPIIAHVIDMFPGETDFHFICNREHLENADYKMRNILNQYCPSGKIYSIEPHKNGPVFAVQKIKKYLSLDKPVVVNYCDFTCYWDWAHFKNFVKNIKCLGSIPAYKGFHPHSLGNTNYAYLKENNGWVEDIQEKQPYTNNRMNEYASSGTYYFSSGRIMFDSFDFMIEEGLEVGGEYYVSLAYKNFVKKPNSVTVYPLQHFMQWGTPEDVDEYNYWSKAFVSLLSKDEDKNTQKGSTVIPMAGLGKRFADQGYIETKPLINVSGLPMVIQSTRDLPKSNNYVFVIRSDMQGYEEVKKELTENFPNLIIKTIDYITDGQAKTATLGVNEIIEDNSKDISPLTIGVCDSGIIYNIQQFETLLNNPEIDLIVWGIKGYANAFRNPKMYGWLETDNNNNIKKVSVKDPLNDPKSDPIILGVFTFKNIKTFNTVTNSLFDRDGKINNEFYMDSCIEDALNLGLKCVLFEVESFLCWGTPNDLKTFEYWQSCFHLWQSHPYKLEDDKRIPNTKLKEIFKNMIDSDPVKNMIWKQSFNDS